MELIKVFLLSTCVFMQAYCDPQPGHTHHHVHHRIHVPQKVHKIYHTKIIKVPEHHHYFHEKEKIIQVETPKKETPLYPPLKEEEINDFSGFDDHHNYYGESDHNIFKKHVSVPTTKTAKRRRKIVRHVKKD